MIIKDRLSKYKSKAYCNLDMFRLQPQGHMQKIWHSKDGTKHLICKMESMHLWYTYNMLKGIIDTERLFYKQDVPLDPVAQMNFTVEFEIAKEQADVARNAIQYIGHELYKRGMMVQSLPEKNMHSKINRADNLRRGFKDSPGETFQFDDDEPGEIGWDGGEFYKR